MAKNRAKKRPTAIPATPTEPEECQPVSVAESSVGDEVDDEFDEDVDEWARRLFDVMEVLTPDDLNGLVDGQDLDTKQAIADVAGITVNPRYIKRSTGLGPLLAARIPHLDPDQMGFVATVLASPFVDAVAAALDEGDDSVISVTGVSVRADSLAVCYAAVIRPDLRIRLDELPVTEVVIREERAAAPDVADDEDDGADASSERVVDAQPVEAALADETGGVLFDPLDQHLIKTAVATYSDILGAPTPEELDLIIDEIVHLNAERRKSLFHAGFVRALRRADPELPESALNEERTKWFVFGLLLGYARADDQPHLVGTAERFDAATRAVVADERMAPSVLPRLVKAHLDGHPQRAAELLDAAAELPLTRADFDQVYESASRQLVDGRTPEAEALFRSLGNHLPVGLRDGGNDLRRRVASCRRALGDFAGASRVLADCTTEFDDPRVGAAVEVERALTAAKVERLRHIAFPHTPEERTNLEARLRTAEPHTKAALRLDISEPRVCWIAGVAAALRNDHKNAAALLENLVGAADPGPALTETGIVSAARFHGALARLQTGQPGVDGPAVGELRAALKEGYRPPLPDLLLAVEWLAMHGSAYTGLFADDVIHLDPAAANEVAKVIASEATGGTAQLVDLAIELGERSSIESTTRFDLLAAALAGAGDPGRVELIAEQLDDLVGEVDSAELDAHWIDLLAESVRLRDLLGHDTADFERAAVLRRLGDDGAAASILVTLTRRALAGAKTHHGAAELVEALVELGHDPTEVDRLREAASTSEEPPDAEAIKEPVQIVFVGGHEAQARYQLALDEEIDGLYEGKVSVHWLNPGWSSNWAPTADEVERLLPATDALVLMTFVRTNLGRRLRRLAGEADVPWISCTGHGRKSLQLAIDRAVEVAVEQRR